MVNDVEERRMKSTKVCYIWRDFCLKLVVRFESVAHPVKSVSRETKGYIQTTFTFSMYYPFEWFINLARSIKSLF